MGVSGAGKTTVGQAIAHLLGWPFEDADSLHPAANISRMHAGHPLDDRDRAPWLALVRAWVAARLAAGQPGVLACSLLRRAYRDIVIAGDQRIALIHLTSTPAVLSHRVQTRGAHFMPASLLHTQLETLEPPTEDEHALSVPTDHTAQQTAREVLAGLRQARPGALPLDPAGAEGPRPPFLE